jgi:glycosyltransferase involved in cell wall biosynthesis
MGLPPTVNPWPRISLVTAVYNGERYLEDTIRSVLEQRYPNLEYIIVDDGSTDGTVEIIKKYQEHLACWFSQTNQGLYPALNAGFARSSGEIMGWLNANDKLHTKGLFVVGSVFRDLPEVEWITGRATLFNDDGMTVMVLPVPRWSRYRFLAGANRYIQQESTYWRCSLWDKAGGALSTVYRAEGDFDLWVRFFRYAKLYPVDALIGGWRSHAGSLSHGNLDGYNRRCDEILEGELERIPRGKWIRMFRSVHPAIRRVPVVRGLWQLAVINSLYGLRGRDWAPVIQYERDKWVMRR